MKKQKTLLDAVVGSSVSKTGLAAKAMKFLGGQNSTLLGFIIITVLIIGFFTIPSFQSELLSYLGLENENSQVAGKIEYKKTEQVQVKRVVDGDTIELTDGRTVRYLNMDTPETKKPGVSVQCFGPEAAKVNKDLVDSKSIWIMADKEDKDRYGRSLRFVFTGEEEPQDIEKSVNAIMVKNGLARSKSYSPNTTYTKVFDQLEKIAKDEKRGVWESCNKPFEE